MIKNIIDIADEKGHYQDKLGNNVTVFDSFTARAAKLTETSGNRHIVERALDYADTYEGNRRERYNLHLVELIASTDA